MKTVHVAAAIICKDNKVLAAQRGYGEFKDGWEFPGGKLESGETGEPQQLADAVNLAAPAACALGGLAFLRATARRGLPGPGWGE